MLLLIAAVVLGRGDQRWLFLVTQAAVLGTVFLSITVITGMAGQISLCQGAFAATGAFAVYQLVQRYDMPVLVAALIGAAIAAALGALLSLPIRRLGGVWTAIATLAFAYFFDSVIVKLSWVGGGENALLQGTVVPRPVVGPFDFSSDKAFLVLCVLIFAVVAAVVVQLRSGTFGRVAVALRGSEVGAGSIGISAGRTRLVAFAISGFIAGLGGALLSMLQGNVNYATNFAPFVALFWIVIVVTLSSRTVQGAAMGAASFALFDAVILKGEIFAWILRSPTRIPGIFPINSAWLYVLFGFGAIQYARHPEGVLEYSKRRQADFFRRRQERRAAASGPPPPEAAPPVERPPRARPSGGRRRRGTVAPLTRPRPRSRCRERGAVGRGHHQEVLRHRRPRRGLDRGGRPGAGRVDRPQRGRQDDLLQLHAGGAASRRRPGGARRGGRDPHAGPRAGPARHRPHLPAPRAVPRRHASATTSSWPSGCAAAPAGSGRTSWASAGRGRDELARCDEVLEMLGLSASRR